jgi:hypothetical protein
LPAAKAFERAVVVLFGKTQAGQHFIDPMVDVVGIVLFQLVLDVVIAFVQAGRLFIILHPRHLLCKVQCLMLQIVKMGQAGFGFRNQCPARVEAGVLLQNRDRAA